MVKTINKYLITCLDGKKYWGTPDEIVCEMRSWDTMCGRVETNKDYMKLVGQRLPGLVTTDDELSFLNNLVKIGNVEIMEMN
tara:strand:- start:14 stop:259 length:246 start_codon:yes stop_codon:yes gene_type:complete